MRLKRLLSLEICSGDNTNTFTLDELRSMQVEEILATKLLTGTADMEDCALDDWRYVYETSCEEESLEKQEPSERFDNVTEGGLKYVG
ncbi:hypothetical protein PR048_025411 [Dryococelus australis]|uniref:Uncharacterized protein n=1 Tax=Dryococelus australis TaxID=614101 RepID=A0ABQ9GRA0_9NEOP|nr:hypothetical protein PR048_025411 [Dryococelus australis]